MLQQAPRFGEGMSAKSVPSMFMGEYVLLRGSLAIAAAMEVDKKATADLSAALSATTAKTKMLATMATLREESAMWPANAASSYLR
jgi:hypothetical protein